MSQHPDLRNCRVVLVRPHYAGNLGATARVMHNFSQTELILVDPLANPKDEEAKRLATHGEFILESARIVKSLEEAVADCVLVVATSARSTSLFRATSSYNLRTLAPILLSTRRNGPVALVFGPEPCGLSNDEIERCHYLLHIPANPDYEALNLAQAVGVCLYELHQSSLQGEAAGKTQEPPAVHAEQERMFEHVRRGLEAIHFLYGDKADALMHAMRHLIGRANPTPMEVKLLHGLARQMEWIAEHLTREHAASFPPEFDEPK
ncbi:MAG TPA: RNA methyltransferase [Gemmataceae bacterium]|jgi:tRNA/rRNA methyltransferase|nr:RNA methyltransferase [Gemmataceae bacterium]